LSGYVRLQKEKGFSDRYLRDITLNFMLAGRDTTSVCSSFCCYLLAANPAKQKKVVNEIDKVIGKQMPTYDLLKKLVYTTAVVNESLRLYPPVPFDPKYSIEDDILPSGYKITTNACVSR